MRERLIKSLLSRVTIDPVAGTVKNNSKEIGFDINGYTIIGIQGDDGSKKNIFVKRSHIIWYFVHGSLPTKYIDHIDQNKKNDSINNLREATVSENGLNAPLVKKSQLPKGVVYAPQYAGHKKPYKATFARSTMRKYIGRYATSEEAEEAYIEYVAVNNLEYGQKI